MKPIITINNLSKFYWDKLLFENVNFTFDQSKYAIIWPNGSGKSTLINCILSPDECSYGDTSIKWLWTQIHQELPQKYYWFTVGEYFRQFLDEDQERRINVILDELELNASESDYISSLSEGTKRKLELAKLLLKDRDIVIMDEPTNHLDIDIRWRLIDWVDNFKWMVLCVTHDRDFINNCFQQIVEVRNKWLYIYAWDYEDYLTSKSDEQESEAKAHGIYMRTKAKEEKLIATIRQRAAIYDSPSRGKLLKSRQKQLARFVAKNEVVKQSKEKTMDLKISGGTHTQKILLSLKWIDISIYGKILISYLVYTIRWSDRLLIVWPNGSGKSTLLNHIVSVLKSETQDLKIQFAANLKWWYFDQNNLGIWGDISVLDWLESKLTINTQTARTKLSNIWILAWHLKTKVSDLSYGQKVKLKFLWMMSQSIDLLIVDEPTNHLDIPTIESLEKMLINYQWAVILVCHDIYFVDKLYISDVLRIG